VTGGWGKVCNEELHYLYLQNIIEWSDQWWWGGHGVRLTQVRCEMCMGFLWENGW